MRIGLLAEQAGVSTKAVRHYEAVGVLPAPARTSGGYREYGPEAVARLAFVRRCRAAGLSLPEIRQVLEVRDAGAAPCTEVAHLLERRLEDVDRQLDELRVLRAHLADRHVRASTADPATCDAEEICRYL